MNETRWKKRGYRLRVIWERLTDFLESTPLGIALSLALLIPLALIAAFLFLAMIWPILRPVLQWAIGRLS